MPKSLRFAVLLLFSISAFSQTVNIRGKVLDQTSQLPLESATVYLTNVADSTVIDYTITDKNGIFALRTRKIAKPVLVKVSFVGYQTLAKEEKSIDNDIDYGVMRLAETENKLNEVVLKGEAPPIRIKNDTLEFNASSFKLRPDANVETLLKQLPGVEIDSEGKITVNGKEVNQILVNGKPFFDKDGKVALQNLPSDIINKVQVTDSKTKAEEISGQAATSNNASINLTIDEDKNKGFFGKATGGFGSDDRYESSLLVNYFKDTRKISVLASANNINSTGFSMNEIFDNMGGGRNYSVWTNDDGSFGINGMSFGGGRGITRSNIVGANYADQWFKALDVNGSYFYTGATTTNNYRASQLNLLPEGNYFTDSSAQTKDAKFAHNFNFTVETKIDSTATLFFNPKFVRSHSSNQSVASQTSYQQDGQLLNESDSDNLSDSDRFNFENSMYFYKSFKRKGRSISASFDNSNSKRLDGRFNRSNTTFYTDQDNDGVPETTSEDNRNQLRNTRNIQDNFSGEITWQEPLPDSLQVKVTVGFRHDTEINDNLTSDFDPVTQAYSALNQLQSNYLRSRTATITPGIGIEIHRKKFDFGATMGTAITRFDNRSVYLGDETILNRRYMLPSANVYGNYKFTKSKSLYLYYNYDIDFPSAEQVLPVANLSNALNTFIGNPDLDPNQRHYGYISFRDYDFSTKSGYSLYGGGNYYYKQIASYTTYDQSRKVTTTYRNVSDTYYGWFGANWSRSIKKEAHSYKFSIGINGGLNKNKGFVNGEGFSARSFRSGPKVNFTYDYGELLSINPSYEFSYNKTWYDNYSIDRERNSIHNFKLQTTSYWPKHVVFGNDFSYSYNSNIADGFKKDFFLWNISLGYNFFSDKLLAKVKVYDVLDQNQSTIRTISPSYVRDEQNDVLKRYVMFSLTYKLEKFGGQKKEGSRFFFHD